MDIFYNFNAVLSGCAPETNQIEEAFPAQSA